MKKLEFENYGVIEMNLLESVSTDGGSIILGAGRGLWGAAAAAAIAAYDAVSDFTEGLMAPCKCPK